MKKFLFSLSLFAISYLLLAAAPAAADVTCTPIYGGGQTCTSGVTIVINKTVQNPQTNVFVDNLGVNDPHFFPDQTINFQIALTNTSGSTISTVTVNDVLPAYVQFVSGVGNFDANSHTLSFQVSNLGVNETRTFTITGKIVPLSQITIDKTVICDDPVVINTATAIANGQVTDTARFCVEKPSAAQPGVSQPGQPTTTKGGLKVFPSQPVTTAPATGPEALPLLALFPSGVAGFFLKKKTRLQ